MASPVTTGLAIELSAKSLTGQVSDGAAFATWPDLSGNTNNAVVSGGGQQPLYRDAKTPNGGPAVAIFGAVLQFTNQAVYTGKTSGEVFLVLAYPGGSSPYPGGYQFGGNDATYMPYQDGNIYDGSFTYSRFNFPAVSPASYHVYNVTHDGSTRTTYVDGVSKHTVNSAFLDPFASNKPLVIGAIQTGTGWNGEIAAFIAYNRSLTSTERGQVLTYLQQQHFVVDTGASITAPPLQATLTLSAVQSSTVPLIAAPALTSILALSATASPYGTQNVVAPAMTSTLTMGSVALVPVTLTPTSPADGDTVEITRPQFVAAFDAHDQSATFTVEIQYADNPGFSNPITLSGDTTAIDGGVHLSATSDVYSDTYWRTRLLQNGQVQLDWSLPLHFTYSAQLSSSDCSITYDVAANASRPIHLWHLVPPAASVGDTVTAYGMGMPTYGQVTLDGSPCTITGWQLESAVIESITASRQIDYDVVDPEHYEIVFTVPDVQPPGGQLEVSA